MNRKGIMYNIYDNYHPFSFIYRLCEYIKTSSNLKCKYIFLFNKGYNMKLVARKSI